MESTLPVVVVIGGGPCGILSLKHLIGKADIFCFESKADIGGMWHFDPVNELTHPDLSNDPYYKLYGVLHSSLYENLQANLPKASMVFKGFPPLPETPYF